METKQEGVFFGEKLKFFPKNTPNNGGERKNEIFSLSSCTHLFSYRQCIPTFGVKKIKTHA